MPGLSNQLYTRCLGILQRCSEFDSDKALRAVFITTDLAPFRGRLPEGTSRHERVALSLAYLLDQQLSNGQAPLSQFLLALQDHYQRGDGLHDELGSLSEAVKVALEVTTGTEEVAESQGAMTREKPAYRPKNADPGLSWLLAQIERMLADGRITIAERDQLQHIYLAALASGIEERLDSPSGANVVPALFSASYSMLNTATDESAIIGAVEGDADMNTGNARIVNHTRSLFTKTARLLARDLADVVQHHTEWPSLIVGDEVTDLTIRSLRAMQSRLRMVDPLSAQLIPASEKKRFQIERDAMMNSALQLTATFEQLGIYQVSGRVPRSIMAQMDRQLDDLSYFTSRCLLWLNELAQNVNQAGAEITQ